MEAECRFYVWRCPGCGMVSDTRPDGHAMTHALGRCLGVPQLVEVMPVPAEGDLNKPPEPSGQSIPYPSAWPAPEDHKSSCALEFGGNKCTCRPVPAEGDMVERIKRVLGRPIQRSLDGGCLPADLRESLALEIVAALAAPPKPERCTCPSTIGGERLRNLACPTHGEPRQEDKG